MSDTFRVLSIDGGGYLGVATACFIRDIEEHFSISFHERFDLFCGTSTGAIIALALASGKSGRELVDIYKTFGTNVFTNTHFVSRAFSTAKSLFACKYSNSNLKSLLDQEFGETRLRDLSDNQKYVLITAYSLTRGAPRIFKTDHSNNLTLDSDYRLADIALASSAAPTYFPLVTLENPRNGVSETYCDGGVAANHPALLGFGEALYEFEVGPSDVRLLSLSTPRTDLAFDKHAVRFHSRGFLGWKSMFPEIFIDSSMYLTDETLRRIIHAFPSPKPTYVRVEMANKHSDPIDLAGAKVTSRLEQLGATQAASNEIRHSVRTILN